MAPQCDAGVTYPRPVGDASLAGARSLCMTAAAANENENGAEVAPRAPS